MSEKKNNKLEMCQRVEKPVINQKIKRKEQEERAQREEEGHQEGQPKFIRWPLCIAYFTCTPLHTKRQQK